MKLCKDCKNYYEVGFGGLCKSEHLGVDLVTGSKKAIQAYAARYQSHCGKEGIWFIEKERKVSWLEKLFS